MAKKDSFMEIKELGALYIYDVLLSYIYPRIFVCEDEFEGKYLFYEMDSDESNDIWLVAKIKRSEYYDLVDKKTPVQAVYRKKEARNLFIVNKIYGKRDKIILNRDYEAWMAYLPKTDVYAEKETTSDISPETSEE